MGNRRLFALIAVACGATVANLYYVQPLLPAIAGDLEISYGQAGLLVTISQLGYALGLLAIVPLGDRVRRRPLCVRLFLACAVALTGAAFSPGFGLLALALGIAAVGSAVIQVLVPFAGTLVPAGERGYVVGLVMSGMLTGILLARTIAGLTAELAGWRAPFALSALVMVFLAVALGRLLPDPPPPSSLPYRRLIASIGSLVVREPLLRRRMCFGFLGFASFSLAWTTLSFLLAGPPFELGEGAIGLLGLAGLAGAVAAQGFGRLNDRGFGRAATGGVLATIVLSWALFLLGADSVVAVVVAVGLLDFAVQGQNVLSQGTIYDLGPEVAGRVTTAYVTSNFVGGALGSIVGVAAWGLGGWSAVCVCGLGFSALALAIWLSERANLAIFRDHTLRPCRQN